MATRILRFFQPFPSNYGLDETIEKNVPKNNSFAEFRISDAKQNQIVFARGVYVGENTSQGSKRASCSLLVNRECAAAGCKYSKKSLWIFWSIKKVTDYVGHFLSITDYASMPRLVRYFFTMRATLKVMASSNSRRSRPVSFLIFSRRYTSVLRWTNSLRAVSETLRLFSKNL